VSTEAERKPDAPKIDKNLKVTVAAPRHPKPKKYTFKSTMLVGAAADVVAEDFGYATGTPTFQNSSENLLDRTKSLYDEGVKDGDEFELVDVGGGV
jgi:hypothetical protein